MDRKHFKMNELKLHLPFCKAMLQKVRGTEFEGQWQKLFDLTSSDKRWEKSILCKSFSRISNRIYTNDWEIYFWDIVKINFGSMRILILLRTWFQIAFIVNSKKYSVDICHYPHRTFWTLQDIVQYVRAPRAHS